MLGYGTASFSFHGMHPSASAPVQQPWMPPPLSISSYALASTMGLVHTMPSTLAATTTITPAPSTGAVVLPGVQTIQHSFTDGIFYRGASYQQVRDENEMPQQTEQAMATELTRKMLRCHVSAAVWLQAAACGLLAAPLCGGLRSHPLRQGFSKCGCVHGQRACCFPRGWWTQSRQLEALCSSMCRVD